MDKILYFAIGLTVLLFALLFTFSNLDDGKDVKSPCNIFRNIYINLFILVYEYKTLCSNKYCLPLDNLLINKII